MESLTKTTQNLGDVHKDEPMKLNRLFSHAQGAGHKIILIYAMFMFMGSLMLTQICCILTYEIASDLQRILLVKRLGNFDEVCSNNQLEG